MDRNLPQPPLLGLGELMTDEQLENLRQQILLQPSLLGLGEVMTDEQLETLKRQIAVHSTISKQLAEIYYASVSTQSSLAGMAQSSLAGMAQSSLAGMAQSSLAGMAQSSLAGMAQSSLAGMAQSSLAGMAQSSPTGMAQSSLAGTEARTHMAYDPFMGTPSHKITTRQRWTPTQSQLQILERLFDQADGTRNKERIKEITVDLSQHGQITETNVYNWFQNRRAKAKRKQQMVPTKDGEFEGAMNIDSPKETKPRFEKDSGEEYPNDRGRPETATGQSSDKDVALDHKPSIGDQFD